MSTGHSADSHSARVATVLQLVVQHCPAVSSTPAQLCTLLQLNQACRTAVQEAVGHLSIRSQVASLTGLSRFADFAAWLPQHAGLVFSIDLPSMRNQEHQDVVKQLMTLSLQACSRQQLVKTTAGHATGGARVMLQLQRYISNFLHSSAVLQSLAAVTALTGLHLYSMEPSVITPAWCAALAALTSLRHVRLFPSHLKRNQSEAVAMALRALTRLQHLDYSITRSGMEHLQLMPRSVRKITLLVEARAGGSTRCDVSHVQGLEDFNLRCGHFDIELVLPASITRLDVDPPLLAMPLQDPLPNLQFVCLGKTGRSLGFLKQLVGFHSLKHIDLDIKDCVAGNLSRVFAAIGAATQLTRIVLHGKPIPEGGMPVNVGNGMPPFLREHLRRLPLLRSLELCGLSLPPFEGLQFSALSKLTSLHLYGCSGVDDFAVVALAASVTGLRRLTLYKCDLHSTHTWAALAGLASLQHLSIWPQAPDLPDDVLQLLAPLTNLTKLIVGVQPGGRPSAAAMAAFVAQMPHLTGITFEG